MRGFPILLLICDARVGNVSLRARPMEVSFFRATGAQGMLPACAGPHFTTYVRRARGECFSACADSQVYYLSATRAGDVSLRARPLEVSFFRATGSRGMLPCVRGAPLYDLRATRAQGKHPYVRGRRNLRPGRYARAGNDSLRARIPCCFYITATRAHRGFLLARSGA